MAKKVLLIATSLCVVMAGISAAQSATLTVSINNSRFNPASVTVAVGDTVTWSNVDSRPHTVTSSGKFDSGFLDTGKSFSFTFAAAGTYPYLCDFHDGMTGTVIVEGSATPQPTNPPPSVEPPPPSTNPSTGPGPQPTTIQPTPPTPGPTDGTVPPVPSDEDHPSIVTVKQTAHGAIVTALQVRGDKVVFKVIKKRRHKQMQLVVDSEPLANLRIR